MAGIKHDKNKPKVSLVDPNFILDLTKVLDIGAEKYGEYNWQEGIQYSRMYSAAQRHMMQFWRGEDLDEESGESHLLHAACNMMFLYWHLRHRANLDDRIKEKTNEHNTQVQNNSSTTKQDSKNETPSSTSGVRGRSIYSD